jgi:hypothetical protein
MEPWQALLIAGVVGIGCQWVGYRKGYDMGYRVARTTATLEGRDLLRPFTIAWGAANWWEDRAKLAEQKFSILSRAIRSAYPGSEVAALVTELEKKIVLPRKENR